MNNGESTSLNKSDTQPRKRKSNNDKKNYGKGPRRKAAQLTLYCGLLPFKALSLLDGNYKTLCKKIDEMRNSSENIMEKRKECGVWLIGFKTFMPDTTCHKTMTENFSKDLCDFYEKNGKRYWKKAKSKVEAETYRIVRNAETIMFMDRLPVTYMLGEKEALDATSNAIAKNTFYTPKELQQSVTKEENQTTFGFTGSRMNGFLTTEGGNYVLYNFSDWTLQVESGFEIRLHNYLNTMLLQKGIQQLTEPLLLYRGDRVFEDLLSPKYIKQSEWIENLEQPYQNVYAVPLEHVGQKMAEIMCAKNWKTTLRTMLLPSDISHQNLPYIVNDGVITYTDSKGNKIERIVFLFCIPDIKRFRKFLIAAKATQNKEQFEVRCYDYQADVVKKLVDGCAYVNVTPFEKVYDYFTMSTQKDASANNSNATARKE